jgi:hypothetical protein
MSRRRALAMALLAAGAIAGGCGNDDRPLPAACTSGTRALAAALRSAPRPVALADGTKLSTCVARARSEADLQNVGAAFTRIADRLAAVMPASDDAALQLGYLIGATRRGARHTSGIHLELVRRLDQTVSLDGPPGPRQAAFRQGVAAGRRDG